MPDEPAAPPQDTEEGSAPRGSFNRTTFTKEADFRGATFTEKAEFLGATFTRDADFRGATFTQEADFRGTTFTRNADFRGATFALDADFGGADFNQKTDFEGATFTLDANFGATTFTRNADFRHATFTQKADFGASIFTQWAIFQGVTFTRGAMFQLTTFTLDANFEGATFIQAADFRHSTFAETANFRGVTFTQKADFGDATFTDEVNFVNAEMKSETTFDKASFLRTPPLLDGATLHEGTTWFGVNWPRSPRKGDARLTVRAYERLKLEMDRLKKHEDELNFFALELRARGVLAGKWSTVLGLTISIYGCLCDYGRSYSRPIWLLGVLSILGAVPFLTHFGLPGLRGSLALSVANTFGILGLRREFFPSSVITDLPWILKLVSGIQTVVGGALIFMFGLGLRNRFRMR